MNKPRRDLKKKINPLQNDLLRYRRKRHLTQREVAYLIGHRQAGHVSAWEAGTKTPSLVTALRLSAALNCPLEILFFPLYEELRHEIHERREQYKRSDPTNY